MLCSTSSVAFIAYFVGDLAKDNKDMIGLGHQSLWQQ